MRIPIIAGNWKMNTTLGEAVGLVQEILERLDRIERVEKVLCPPFISLARIKELTAGSSLKLGAQNLFFEEKGAYTGEVSPLMLADLCQFVILGHSERRAHFGETDEVVNRKIKAALKVGLIPIMCVGESLKENESGRSEEVVSRQVKAALAGVRLTRRMVIAYEPIWAIGTGRAATGEQANTTIRTIRVVIAELYGNEQAQSILIQYGGSVTASNIAEFIQQPEIDGALVGGASLKPAEFISIVEQTSRIKRTG